MGVKEKIKEIQRRDTVKTPALSTGANDSATIREEKDDITK